MKIFFIVDETPFFLPQWLDGVITATNKKNQVIGITPLITHGKPTFYNYMYQNILAIGIVSIIKVLILYVEIILKKVLFVLNISSSPMSIRQVAKKHNIKIIETEDVNDNSYLHRLRELKPDIIISSCSQIFYKNLLSLPKKGCINRHSGLLPSYGGVFPVFYAMINKEKYIGVTVHKMVEAIDAGSILSQGKIMIDKNDTLFSLYKKAYETSIEVTGTALDVMAGEQNPVRLSSGGSSYYSFPEKKDWNTFKQLGLKFI